MKMRKYKDNVPFGYTTMALLRVLPVLLKDDRETTEAMASFDSLEYVERRLRWPLLLSWIPVRYREVCKRREEKNKRAREKAEVKRKNRIQFLQIPAQMPDQPAAPLKVGRKAKGKRDSCDCCKKAAKAGRFIKVNGSVVCMSCLLS